MIETGMRTPPADASLAVTEQYTEAYNLNVKIHTSMQAIQQNLYDMCSALKRMRDGKLYKELGYQNFEDYCKEEAGISRQHAYRYIAIVEKLPADFVMLTRQKSEEKLYLLTALTDDQREEITQTVDLESTTVRELKEQIAALQSAKESAEADAAQAKDAVQEAEEAREHTRLTLKGMLDKHIEHERSLEAQIKELENKPQDVAVVDRTEEIDRLNAEIEKLRQQINEKPDTQLALGVEPIYQNDTKSVFKPYLTAAVDALNRLTAFMEQNAGDTNMDFFVEKSEAALSIVGDRIAKLKGV